MQHRGQESGGHRHVDGPAHGRREADGLRRGHLRRGTSRAPARAPRRSATSATRRRASRSSRTLSRSSTTRTRARSRSAHNGNLVNADEIRARAGAGGLDLHDDLGHGGLPPPDGALAARGRRRRAARGARARARRLLDRPPRDGPRDRGARPAGDPPADAGPAWVDGPPDARVVASETCAFDLIDAEPLRDVEPGEIVVFDAGGTASASFAMGQRTAFCIFEHVYFARPDSSVFGKSVAESRRAFGRRLAREHPVPADVVVPVPDSGDLRGARVRRGERDPLRHGARAQPLRRPHVHRAEAVDPALRRQGEAERRPLRRRRQARRPRGRFDRARHDVEEDRQDAQGRGRERGPHADLVAADDEPVPLRDRHAAAQGAHRRDARPRRRRGSSSRPTRSATCRSRACSRRSGTTRTRPARPASRAGIRCR